MKIRFACSPSGGDALHRAYAETTVRRALRPVGATVQLMEICLDAEAGRARLRASCPPASSIEMSGRMRCRPIARPKPAITPMICNTTVARAIRSSSLRMAASVAHAKKAMKARSGQTQDGRKVRGTIHWVSADVGVRATVRLYAPLFTDR